MRNNLATNEVSQAFGFIINGILVVGLFCMLSGCQQYGAQRDHEDVRNQGYEGENMQERHNPHMKFGYMLGGPLS
jgi:hypothetical protein